MQALADHGDHPFEVGADAVELVDEADARHLILVGLPPDGLGLWLDAGNAVEDHHAAIEHTQAALHLGGEVHMAGRVDHVDLVIAPESSDGGGHDGDAPLAFLLHVVGGGSAVMNLTHAMHPAGVVQHPFGGGGFARVDVRDDADIAHSGEVQGLAVGLLNHVATRLRLTARLGRVYQR